MTYLPTPTPNIEAFINEGIVFTNAYTAGPKCSPSRYSTLTGRQPPRSEWAIERTLHTTSGEFGTNVTIQTSKLYYNDSRYNIPYVLQNDASTPYYTGVVGKWHIMSSSDNGYSLGCSSLNNAPDATLYAQCTDIIKEQGFDFVDAWYHGNILTNTYYSHNPEWMVSQSKKFIEQAQAENKPFFL